MRAVPDEDIKKSLKVDKNAAPALRIFTNGDYVNMLAICADEHVVRVNEPAEVIDGILTLICLYYVGDIMYPKCYSQLLVLLQELVVQEKYS